MNKALNVSCILGAVSFFLFVSVLSVHYLGRSEPRRPLTGVDVVEAEAGVAEAAAGRDVSSGRVALTPALLFLFSFVLYVCVCVSSV